MPSQSELKREGYKLQRGSSHGATITLVSGCCHYTALFECANRVAEVLGQRGLADIGDGIFDVIASYKIPIEDLYFALQKLSQKYSVALVEYCATKTGGRFVCLWRIAANAPVTVPAPAPSTNLDDY